MKSFFARLFNLFTIIATLSFLGLLIVMEIKNGSSDKSPFFIFFGIWFGAIAGLNYLVLGKPTLWNGKQD